MNKFKHINFVVALCLILTMSSMLVACNSEKKSDDIGSDSSNGNQDIISVSIEIEYPAEAETDAVKGTANVHLDATVLDALTTFTEKEGILLAVQNGTTPYVQGIDSVFENDYMKPSGWVYELNGESVMLAANEQKVQDGDTILWKYISFDDF